MNYTSVYTERKRVHTAYDVKGFRYFHAARGGRVSGFTLLEVVVGIAIIAIVAGTLATIFPFNIDVVRKGTEDTEVSMVAQSVKDAIITGARENYNPYDNYFFFIFEGVAVAITLPAEGKKSYFPGGYYEEDDEEVINGSKTEGFKKEGTATLGLYPAGLLYKGRVMQVFRFNNGLTEIKDLTDENGNPLYDYFIGPPLEEDFNLNGVLDSGEDVNRNSFLDTPVFDTFEDVGIDGKRDELEDGYDPILNPDPAGDNYDPVRNPSGTERNGRLDNGEDLNKNGYLDVPDFKAGVNGYYPLRIETYLQDPSIRITNYGYTVKVINEGGNVFTFEVAVYKDFFKVRPGLQSARQDVLDAAALPEEPGEDQEHDYDGDGLENELDRVKTDADNKIDRGATKGAALPEILFDGMDNDGDDCVDDGLVKPDFVVRFQMIF